MCLGYEEDLIYDYVAFSYESNASWDELVFE